MQAKSTIEKNVIVSYTNKISCEHIELEFQRNDTVFHVKGRTPSGFLCTLHLDRFDLLPLFKVLEELNRILELKE